MGMSNVNIKMNGMSTQFEEKKGKERKKKEKKFHRDRKMDFLSIVKKQRFFFVNKKKREIIPIEWHKCSF